MRQVSSFRLVQGLQRVVCEVVTCLVRWTRGVIVHCYRVLGGVSIRRNARNATNAMRVSDVACSWRDDRLAVALTAFVAYLLHALRTLRAMRWIESPL